MLVVGRIVGGFAIGIASTTVYVTSHGAYDADLIRPFSPMYQAEITAPSIRGRMTSLQQWVRIISV